MDLIIWKKTFFTKQYKIPAQRKEFENLLNKQ